MQSFSHIDGFRVVSPLNASDSMELAVFNFCSLELDVVDPLPIVMGQPA